MGLSRPGLATSGDLDLDTEVQARIGLVLEGTRSQMPVYCTPFPKVRLEGRAIPERLLLRPDAAGLANAPIQWVTLQPGRDPGRWDRVRYNEGDGQWTLELLDLPGETAPGVSASWGTVRFAAAISVPKPGGGSTSLESSGWSRAASSLDGDSGPGIRVSRPGMPSLSGAAFALARIPFVDEAPAHFAARRIALRPIDLPFGAVETLGRVRLPGERTVLPSPEWDWLFRTVQTGVRRRGLAGAPLVDAKGRPVALSFAAPDTSSRAKPGDVIVAEGRYAILEGDDGDGWIGESDPVIHALNGTLQVGVLGDLPGKKVDLLRMRDFSALRSLFGRAGYEVKGRPSPAPTPELLHACAAFQRDRGLGDAGVPDSATVAALNTFVARLAAADSSSAPAGAGRAAPDSAAGP